MEVKPGFRDTEKVSLSPKYKGVPSLEIKDTKVMLTFFLDLCPLNGGVCPLNRGEPKERFHCN